MASEQRVEHFGRFRTGKSGLGFEHAVFMAPDIGDMICGIQQVSETAGKPGGKFPIPVDGEAGRIGLISLFMFSNGNIILS